MLLAYWWLLVAWFVVVLVIWFKDCYVGWALLFDYFGCVGYDCLVQLLIVLDRWVWWFIVMELVLYDCVTIV